MQQCGRATISGISNVHCVRLSQICNETWNHDMCINLNRNAGLIDPGSTLIESVDLNQQNPWHINSALQTLLGTPVIQKVLDRKRMARRGVECMQWCGDPEGPTGTTIYNPSKTVQVLSGLPDALGNGGVQIGTKVCKVLDYVVLPS